MPKSLKTLIAAAALGASAGLAPALYAHDSANSDDHDGSMMGSGMTGMMNMMEQMSDMMDGCNKMMQSSSDGGGSGKPNEQWRRDAPAAPDANG